MSLSSLKEWSKFDESVVTEHFVNKLHYFMSQNSTKLYVGTRVGIRGRFGAKRSHVSICDLLLTQISDHSKYDGSISVEGRKRVARVSSEQLGCIGRRYSGGFVIQEYGVE